MIEWNDTADPTGAPTREFRIQRSGKRDVTGAVWLPDAAAAGRTLVCFGHGASGDRYQPPICHLAKRFAREAGLPVLSIDGPVHGLRQVGEGGRKAFWPEFQREGALEEMTQDWTDAVAAARALPGVGEGKLAYFGLSMGSIFGIPFVASRNDVVAATLGLFGVEETSPHSRRRTSASMPIPVFIPRFRPRRSPSRSISCAATWRVRRVNAKSSGSRNRAGGDTGGASV